MRRETNKHCLFAHTGKLFVRLANKSMSRPPQFNILSESSKMMASLLRTEDARADPERPGQGP